MYGSSRVPTAIKKIAVVMLCALLPVTLLASPLAEAASVPTLLYDYQFIGANGTVVNSAPSGVPAPLTLSGNWQPVPDGVQFSGNTTGEWSVAYGRPTSGDTLNEPPTVTVGFGSEFTYQAPANGTCFADTPNITQIGRYHVHDSQAKIQLSSCSTSRANVMVECRFSGSLTPPGTPPVVSTLPLISGDTYVATCMKSPDRRNNTAAITLSVTDLGAAKGEKKVVDTFTVAAIGYMQSTQYISAGNKYPLPLPDNNTDQFNGIVTNAAFCAGASAEVSTCLSANLSAGAGWRRGWWGGLRSVGLQVPVVGLAP